MIEPMYQLKVEFQVQGEDTSPANLSSMFQTLQLPRGNPAVYSSLSCYPNSPREAKL